MKHIAQAPQDLQDAVREFWPESEWDNAVSIAYLESQWRRDARNDTTRGGDFPCGQIIAIRLGVRISSELSLGYFQINACNFPTWDPETLLDPRENAGTAHMLWDTRGWYPWYYSALFLGLIKPFGSP